MKKTEQILNTTRHKILSGAYGNSGEQFLAIRDFADREGIAYLTACHVFSELREEGLLFLLKKRWFLCNGICSKNSPLGKHTDKKIIGLHVKEINNPYISENVFHLQKILSKEKTELVIRTSENDSQNEKSALRFFIEIGCEGVINFPSSDESLISFYKSYPLPMVFVGRIIDEKLVSIITDNYGMGSHIAKFLHTRGYSSFLFVGLQQFADPANERLNGFISYLHSENLSFSTENIHRLNLTNNTYVTQFMNCLRSLIKTGNTVGIFCLNDLLAYKALKIVERIGFSVPEQVGIVGYDNLPISALSKISITSVSYDYKELAREAYSILSGIVKTRKLIRPPKTIPNHLVIRNSTK